MFGLKVAACWLVSCVDQSSAFTTKGIATPTRISSVFQAATESNDSTMATQRDPETGSLILSKSTFDHASKLFGTALLSASLLFGSVLTVSPDVASANDSKVIGQLKGSGLVFKDTLSIERFEDPKVKGVILYISNFDRPVTEKLSKGNFFNDPSYASVACARTGQKVAIASNINKTPQGEEVFEESRSLLFKTLRVQRVYDEDTNTAVYVSYNTRFDKNDDTNKSRFKSSLCAVNLEDPVAPPAFDAAAKATSSDPAVAPLTKVQ